MSSFFRKIDVKFRKMSSFFRKSSIKFRETGSFFRKTESKFRETGSLFRKNRFEFLKAISFLRINEMKFRTTISFLRKNKVEFLIKVQLLLKRGMIFRQIVLHQIRSWQIKYDCASLATRNRVTDIERHAVEILLRGFNAVKEESSFKSQSLQLCICEKDDLNFSLICIDRIQQMVQRIHICVIQCGAKFDKLLVTTSTLSVDGLGSPATNCAQARVMAKKQLFNIPKNKVSRLGSAEMGRLLL